MANNYNQTLQSNNTDLQGVLQTLQTKAAGGAQATPVISVSSNGLITATAGSKSSTHQLAFQAAKTITPSTASQIAVSSGYYTGGNVAVKGDSNLTAGNIKSGVSIFGVNGTYVGSGSSGGDTSVEDALITRIISGTYTNDRTTTIGNYAFYYCTSLTSVNFPKVTTIGSSAFCVCTSLTSVNFPVATSIGSYAFDRCSSLTSVNFPKVTTIGSSAFCVCSKLTSVNFPVATSIGSYTFFGCSKLTTASFPVATSIGSYAFYHCSKLTSVSFPVATSTGTHTFLGCSKLTTASFPVATTIGTYAFGSCDSLTSVSLPKATSISNYAFNKCYNLKSLYLTGSSFCTLSGSSAFSSTPIGGYSASAGTYGSIYVPASLLAAYKTATNWTYFSSRFVGI